MKHFYSVCRVLLPFLAAQVLFGCHSSKDDPPPPPTTYSISGSVSPASPGTTIRVAGSSNLTATTDSAGAFAIRGLAPGDYRVAPIQAGSVFAPVEVPVHIVAADVVVPPFVRAEPEEGLSAAESERLGALPERLVPLNEIILPNNRNVEEYMQSRGLTLPPLSTSANPATPQPLRTLAASPPTGPQQRKNDVVALMVAQAHDFACGRGNPRCTKWDYPAGSTDPVNNPAQKGLTYVYNGKTPSVRTLPGDGCPQKTYGVDCSGMITNVASAAGLSAPAGSTAQSDPDKWTIPADWKLKMKLVSDGSIQTGDLLWWSGHIGIAAGPSEVISSTGGPGLCATNIDAKHGPRNYTIAQLGRGQPAKVLRLTTTLSGAWDMYIRCSDQTTDAAVIRFNINNDSGGAFTANGSGTDYNGTPLSFVLSGNYDQNSNTIEATLSLTDGTRADKFTQTLLEDDTGYFPLAKSVDNGGCAASARLVRVAEGSPLAVPAPPQERSRPSSSLLRPQR